MAFRLSRAARLVHFLAADRVRLEGRLTAASPERGVVLCHPHPLYGGSMLTPVILTVEQAFQAAGWTTLAFNFRWVGGSGGTHDEGRAEVADVTGALDFVGPPLPGAPPVVRQRPGLAGRSAAEPPALVIAGYSFGSFVGGQVASTDPRVDLYLGIAPPLNRYDFGFLRAARCRIALIGATRDEFCDPARLEALVAGLPGSPWVRFLDTDHFFADALDELAAACADAIAWAG